MGTWLAQAAEHGHEEISVVEQLQPDLKEATKACILFLFYMLPPKIKINMCQTSDV